MTESLLAVEDLANLLRVGPQHVRRMAREGRLPPSLPILKREYRWRRETIDDWLRAGCPAPEKPQAGDCAPGL